MVHSEVIVNEPVTHTRNFSPFHFGITGFEVQRYLNTSLFLNKAW
jgi:hypothetical protein